MKLWSRDKKPKENNKSYVWYRDSKMIGTIMLLIVAALQIFAFLKVPGLTTIHAYTIGMLLGYYNPFFYVFAAYFALKLIFGKKIELPKWLKLNSFTYWFVVLSFVFIGTSLFFYQTKTGFTAIGAAPWGSFKDWFHTYTSEPAWAPANTNGGIVGAFMYSLIASMSSGIGAIITSIVLAALSVSIVISGSFIGFYRSLINRRHKELRDNEEKIKSEILPEPTMKTRATQEMPKRESAPVELEETPKEDTTKVEDDFPFEDPFK